MNEEPKISLKRHFPTLEDFAFWDDAGRPYRVRIGPDGPMASLYYWNKGASNWVRLRAVDAVERTRIYIQCRLMDEAQTFHYTGGVPFLRTT